MSDLVVHVRTIALPNIPGIGFGSGYDDAGRRVDFVGDAQSMVDMVIALDEGREVTIRVPLDSITAISTPQSREAGPS